MSSVRCGTDFLIKLLLQVIVSLATLTHAHAHCDLAGFDKTPPRAIKATVTDQFADFEWASDIDIRYDRPWRHNYIFNKHREKSWSGHWEKGGITIPVSFPLAPFRIFCREVLFGQYNSDPDTNAPIIYGTNRQIQPAATYVDQASDHRQVSMFFHTSYVDRSGDPREIHFDLNMIWKGGSNLQFSFSSLYKANRKVGLSRPSEFLSELQIAQLEKAVRDKGRLFQITSPIRFSGEEAVRDLFPNRPELADVPFLIIDEDFVEMIIARWSGQADRITNEHLLIFDNDRHALLRLDAPLLVLK